VQKKSNKFNKSAKKQQFIATDKGSDFLRDSLTKEELFNASSKFFNKSATGFMSP